MEIRPLHLSKIVLLFALFVAAALVGACTDVNVKRQRQGIVLRNIPPKAIVYIDGKAIGIGAAVNRRALPLSKGKHRIAIVDTAYYSYSSTFTLYGGDLLKRRIRMYRRLDE